MGVKFIHPHGQHPAKWQFDLHLSAGTHGVQMAVCFFLKAGLEILRPHVRNLRDSNSFVVVSLDTPTNLDSVAELHSLMPGHVFIHLGWVTPEEKKGGGAALMHSKVCLSIGSSTSKLWVGSHNLTASAMGGANIEAALLYDATEPDAVMQDARQHLAECRASAEMFDPARLEEYKQMQSRKAGAIGVMESILVLHAEEIAPINAPAVIHMRLPTTEYDAITKTDSPVHLFVHPAGSLGTTATIGTQVRRYTGRIIEDNRTEHHPGGGSASTMTNATHWLEFGPIPQIVTPNSVTSAPVTQAAIMLERREPRSDEFIYSINAARTKADIAATDAHVDSRETPSELLPYFSGRSKEEGRLIFAPREHMTEASRVTVFRGTPIPARFKSNLEKTETRRGPKSAVAERSLSRKVYLDVAREEAVRKWDPYLFRSSFRISSDDTQIE